MSTTKEKLAQGPKAVVRWALWSKVFGFYKRFPHDGEELYESKRSAMAALCSGIYADYKPVKVKLVPEAE